jgi:hypothetical protein
VNAQSIIEAIGLGDLTGGDILAIQLIILAASIGLFAISLVMMIVASKSARGARKARADAEGYLRSAQDFAVEARQLSAHRDKAAARGMSAGDAPSPIRVSARETTPEADIEIMDLKPSDVVSNRNLDAVKESVTVPKRVSRWRRRG